MSWSVLSMSSPDTKRLPSDSRFTRRLRHRDTMETGWRCRHGNPDRGAVIPPTTSSPLPPLSSSSSSSSSPVQKQGRGRGKNHRPRYRCRRFCHGDDDDMTIVVITTRIPWQPRQRWRRSHWFSSSERRLTGGGVEGREKGGRGGRGGRGRGYVVSMVKQKPGFRSQGDKKVGNDDIIINNTFMWRRTTTTPPATTKNSNNPLSIMQCSNDTWLKLWFYWNMKMFFF